MKFSKEDIKKSMLLYAITDRMWLKNGESLTNICEEVIKNGATFLQIREKDLDKETFEIESKELKLLCNKYRVPFVVNDSVEIAMQINADGVHVGQSDIKGRDIRSIIGTDKILGISAGTIEEAIAAENAEADYIGVGAVFVTNTKKNAENISMEKLYEIRNSVSIPVVAIGGINKENISELSRSKVNGVAVISAIFGAKDIGKATKELLLLAKDMINIG